MKHSNFDLLVSEALVQDFSGWDFSWVADRWDEEDTPWNYPQIVQDKIRCSNFLLDMGTGGGEFLASLPTLPNNTWATESYPPNISIARARLEPMGVSVVPVEDHKMLPLPDEVFDLVINRHEYYWMPEVHRFLKPRGTFLTQQVGYLDCIQINEYLQAPKNSETIEFTLEKEVMRIEKAGFWIIRSEEAFLDSIFHDIGAIVFFLKVINWQIPNFSVDTYRDQLINMHQTIKRDGTFHAKAHRFLIEAKKV